MDVLRRFYEDYGARLGGLAWRDFGEVERALRAKGFLDALARPRLAGRLARRPRALAAHLAGALAEAADGILDADEQRLLFRSRAGFGWSDGDVPLLDEARALLAEAPPRRSAT